MFPIRVVSRDHYLSSAEPHDRLSQVISTMKVLNAHSIISSPGFPSQYIAESIWRCTDVLASKVVQMVILSNLGDTKIFPG